MEKKSKWLIMFFLFSIIASIVYTYFNYVYWADFFIDISQVETEELEEIITRESTPTKHPIGVLETE